MDALSETLRVVHLVGAIFINARFTAPWCYQSPRADTVAPILEPGAERVVIFHMITEGECWVELDGEAPLQLSAEVVRLERSPGRAGMGLRILVDPADRRLLVNFIMRKHAEATVSRKVS